jgi:hypothetical protein
MPAGNSSADFAADEVGAAGLRARVEALTAERDRLDAELAAQCAELAALAALRDEHLRQIAGLELRVAALHASTSWRLTRPLRLLGRAMARLRWGGTSPPWRKGP